MLSKFGKTLRSLIGGESENSTTKSRKRTFDNIDEDVIASTPNKKIKQDCGNPNAADEHWHLGKVAEWIVKKKRTFSESYYFRTLTDHVSPKKLVDKIFPSNCNKHLNGNRNLPNTTAQVPYSSGFSFQPRFSFADMDRGPRPSQATAHSTPKRVPPGGEMGDHPFQFMPPQAMPYSQRDGHFKMPSAPRHPMMSSDRPTMRPAYRVTPHYSGSRPPPGGSGGYQSMYNKTFMPHSSRSCRNVHARRNKLAAEESVRMEEKSRYAQLLQRFTTTPLPGSVFGNSYVRRSVSTSSSTKSKETILGSSVCGVEAPHSTAEPHMRRVQVHLVNRQAESPDITERTYLQLQEKQENRKRESRGEKWRIEQARNADASFTQAPPRLPESPERGDTIVLLDDDEEEGGAFAPTPTPAARDKMPCSRPSPIGAKSPSSETFEKSLRDSKYISEDWIKDIHNKYSSESRSIDREIQEEEIKVKFMKSKREEWEDHLEKRLLHKLTLASKEPPVLEEEYVEEEEEEEFPELTDEMEQMIDDALHPYPPGQVLSDAFRLQITRNDIDTLSGLNWLNDEIINFYMELIRDRGTQEERPSVHVFNTFFYPKVMSGGHQSVRRWTKKVDIFSVDYILIPVHLGMHWCLAVIDLPQKEIRYYDSMGGENQGCLRALSQYLHDEHKAKKCQQLDMSGWKQVIVKKIPHQMNGSDCGVFTCKFADYITQNREITFTQEHMPYFRRKMVYEILTKKLL